MSYEKGSMIYEGKAKKVFEVVGHSDIVWVEYKDDLTAFNALKKGTFDGKGEINCQITALIYKFLASRGIETHLVAETSPRDLVCKKLKIIPLEVVTRNILAGSTAKKLGLAEGTPLDQPLVEFYYKDDSLNDPFISDDQALLMKAGKNQQELEELKTLARKINTELRNFFKEIRLDLIDFKLEFGRDPNGQLMLGDEISPDTCRLWDHGTGEKMDKDRFRRDLGKVAETYQNVLKRMKERWA
jgi:phosphoribosylaminoimidazole-succinocarboxamide synthase